MATVPAMGACGAPALPAPVATVPVAGASIAAPPSVSTSAEPLPSADPKLDFAEVARDLTKRCGSLDDTPNLSNVDMKERARQIGECKRKAMIAALDVVLVPLRARDGARFKALMAEQAAFSRYVDAACWLSEEADWVDFDDGTRDDGSARSTTLVACDDAASVERFFFARTLAETDVAGFARRVEATQAQGTKNEATLRSIGTQLQELVKKPIAAKGPNDPHLPEVLDKARREELVLVRARVADGGPALARQTCDDWPALAQRLGGAERCARMLSAYYFSIGSYEGMGEDD